MYRLKACFNADGSMTSDLAAEILRCASKFESVTQLEMGSTRVVLGSLIGILSLELRRGREIEVIAEGVDEIEAAEKIKEILER